MCKKSLSGRVTVITGATGGLGVALAEEFHKRGAVVVPAARNVTKLEALRKRIGEGLSLSLDVTRNEDVRQAVQEVLAKYGRIDIWINNAGYGVFEELSSARLEELDGMMDANYMGTVRCVKELLPHMMLRREGTIVNIASLAGKIGSAKATGYSASKHAVLGFTNSLRMELYGSGIDVLAVNPGPIDTPFFDRADPSGHYVENVKWFMLTPEKVAARVADAVERRKKEIDLPWSGAAGTKLMQLFPRLMDGVANRILNKK